MMSLAWWLLFLLPGHAETSKAGWTDQKPIPVTLVAYEENCARFKAANGEIFAIRRETLPGLRLWVKETKIEFFPETMKKNLCSRP